MRYVSWVVVLVSAAWLVAGTLGVRPGQFTLPEMPGQTVAGTTAPMLPAAPRTPIEPARLPYADVYPLLTVLKQVEGLDRVSGTLTWTSVLPGVEADDMEMYISDDDGKHVFKPGPDGRLTLPVRPDWRDSGLVLQSNQPQEVNGMSTTELTLKMDFAVPPATSVAYEWLWESANQMQFAIDLMPGNAAPGSRRMQGLVVQFPAAEATVTVHSSKREEVLQAGPDGYVRLPLLDGLREENPRVEFSEPPSAIGPWVP